MKPLILDFAEQPQKIRNDISMLEYSHELNLTIYKETGKPAISEMELTTETVKKSKGAPSDSDKNSRLTNRSKLSKYYSQRTILETRTYTEAEGEASDSD